MQQLFDAVRYLHHHNVCHRDLKPENAVLSQHGFLKIIDFGAACHCDDNTILVDSRVGTREYRAPEVSKGHYNKLSDMYSLGIMMHRMLLGTHELMHPCFYSSRRSTFGRLGADAKDLLLRLIEKDSLRRPSAEEAIAHPFVFPLKS